MRYLPSFLHRLFKPVPLMMNAEEGDPIARDLEAAIQDHETVGRRERETFANDVVGAINDCLKRLAKDEHA